MSSKPSFMIMSRCNRQGPAVSICFRKSVARRWKGKHNRVEGNPFQGLLRLGSAPVTITLRREPLPGCDPVFNVIIGE
jgi:hypothetical protein